MGKIIFVSSAIESYNDQIFLKIIHSNNNNNNNKIKNFIFLDFLHMYVKMLLYVCIEWYRMAINPSTAIDRYNYNLQ